MTEPTDFSAEAFRRLCTTALHPEPTDAAARGDHDLVPDLELAPSPRPAAVLVPVVLREEGMQILLTLRSAHLPNHAGQIAFPGGKIDPGDADALAAALREAEEEIGLDRSLVTPLGYLDTYLSASGFRVVPVVGLIDPTYHVMLNPGEVDEAFEVPLAHLMTPANHLLGTRPWRGTTRPVYVMNYGPRSIWGLTAGIIRNLYDRVYGP